MGNHFSTFKAKEQKSEHKDDVVALQVQKNIVNSFAKYVVSELKKYQESKVTDAPSHKVGKWQQHSDGVFEEKEYRVKRLEFVVKAIDSFEGVNDNIVVLVTLLIQLNKEVYRLWQEETESPLQDGPRGLRTTDQWGRSEYKLSDQRIPFLGWQQPSHYRLDDPLGKIAYQIHREFNKQANLVAQYYTSETGQGILRKFGLVTPKPAAPRDEEHISSAPRAAP